MAKRGKRIIYKGALIGAFFCLVITIIISTNLYLYCYLWYLYTIKPYVISLCRLASISGTL